MDIYTYITDEYLKKEPGFLFRATRGSGAQDVK